MKVGGTCPAFPFLPLLVFTVSPPGVLPRNPTSEAVGCRVLLSWERAAPCSLRARHPSRRDKLTASSPRLCCRGHLQPSLCLCSLTSSPPPGCPPGFHGAGCQQRCDCEHGAACDPATGRCRCPAGVRGQRCQAGTARPLCPPKSAAAPGAGGQHVPAPSPLPKQAARKGRTGRDAGSSATA